MATPDPFILEVKSPYAVVRVNVDVDAENASALCLLLMSNIPTYAYKRGMGIILDLQAKHNLDHYFFAEAAAAAKVAKDSGSAVVLLNCPAPTTKLIKEKGLDGLFPVVLSLEKALAHIGIEAPKTQVKIDVEFVNPFISGTIETLKVQCSTAAQAGKPYLKGTRGEANIAIAAILGLISKPFSGSIAICFPEKVFLAIMGRMLGETFTRSPVTWKMARRTPQHHLGQAKKALNERNLAVESHPPWSGQDLYLKHMTMSSAIRPLRLNTGLFYRGRDRSQSDEVTSSYFKRDACFANTKY